MQDPYNKIIDFLHQNNIQFEITEHEAVFTSEQAANVRGFSLHQGAKALLLKAGENFVLAVLPGDKKLDSKKLKKLLQVHDIRFAKPSEVVQVMGCEIGACYPFGNLLNIQMFVDPSLSENQIIGFNPGVHTKSLKMKWEDYKKAVNPTIVEISL